MTFIVSVVSVIQQISNVNDIDHIKNCFSVCFSNFFFSFHNIETLKKQSGTYHLATFSKNYMKKKED